MEQPLPRLALWLGLGGLAPFFAGALLAALGPAQLHLDVLAALAGYGAVILSFLGAVHWGLALRAPQAEAQATPYRLVLGVVPSLIGWVALMLPLGAGLGLLAAGILATAGVETLATSRRLLPAGYLALRWVLSLGAAAALVLGLLAA